mmetsp:Transcript_6127/g.38047  ORF Transcript_6127/g.38047 Transcript_6127/m.38047 type:complete len:112 (-) Transcript_6127:1015-1350(-)
MALLNGTLSGERFCKKYLSILAEHNAHSCLDLVVKPLGDHWPESFPTRSFLQAWMFHLRCHVVALVQSRSLWLLLTLIHATGVRLLIRLSAFNPRNRARFDVTTIRAIHRV